MIELNPSAILFSNWRMALSCDCSTQSTLALNQSWTPVRVELEMLSVSWPLVNAQMTTHKTITATSDQAILCRFSERNEPGVECTRPRRRRRRSTHALTLSVVSSSSAKDGNDTDQFELRVLDAGRAELRMLLADQVVKELAAEGVPVPKPFALTRQVKD